MTKHDKTHAQKDRRGGDRDQGKAHACCHRGLLQEGARWRRNRALVMLLKAMEGRRKTGSDLLLVRLIHQLLAVVHIKALQISYMQV